MSDHVLRHPDLPDQPIVVHVEPGQELSPEYDRMRWAVDESTDPVDVPVLPSVPDEDRAAVVAASASEDPDPAPAEPVTTTKEN